MGRLTEVFSVGEGMQLLRGDFNMPDFCKRTQKFWISEMGGYDTKQARGAIIKKIRAEAEKHLHLPEKCKDSIVEPIDPVIMINDLVGAMS